MTLQLTEIENPFATRFTRPGELAYLFPAGESFDGVLERFAKLQSRGAIVGPHGSGKSTLLAALVSQLEALGRRVRAVALHDGERRLPRGFTANAETGDVFVVDGYEQLGWPARWKLGRVVSRSGAGLLVTSHREIRGLPTVLATQASLAVTTSLVERLVADLPRPSITTAELRRSFERNDCNVREVFFELYDLYELRRL